jgi:NAD(P)-dependent dehydrogenase (short-subunit alcohol dehydrogenase family)
MLDRFRLDGRIAIVIGASSGLGVAFAQALAEVGATVVPVLVQRLVALKQALIASKLLWHRDDSPELNHLLNELPRSGADVFS